MKRILDLPLTPDQAALWFVGQACFVSRAGDLTVAIDPYLSDSCGKGSPKFARRVPSPLAPEDMKVEVIIITHDHLDHLDPETLERYPHRDSTTFVAPRFAARKLAQLGIRDIVKVDHGETAEVRGATFTGVFALATGPDAVDTAGYHVTFANGRNWYHASDTAFCELLLQAAPKTEVLITPINGKWGNLDVEESIALTEAVQPRYVIPCHYDVMALNSENPETFRYFWSARGKPTQAVVLDYETPFVWGAEPMFASDAERFVWMKEHLYVPAVCDVLDGLGYRTQAMHQRLRPLDPNTCVIVGRARTFRWMETDFVVQEDPYGQEIEAMDSLQPGDVVVHSTDHAGTNAPWGELMSTVAVQRGAVGCICDSQIRDCLKIIALGFPVFHQGIRPLDSMGRARVMAYDVPVRCGEVLVKPGELVFADFDGVVVIPQAVEEEALRLAAEKVGKESASRAELKAGKTLREVFDTHGVL